MIDFFNSGIIKDLQQTFQECFDSFQKNSSYDVYMIGTSAFTSPKSKDYGNSYFDYGTACRVNMTDNSQEKPKRIFMGSTVLEWAETNIQEHCRKYGIRWLYEVTKNDFDKTAFFYEKFDINYLKSNIFMECQRIYDTRNLIINTNNIYIENEKVFYGIKKDE